jgi:hypothetical protein
LLKAARFLSRHVLLRHFLLRYVAMHMHDAAQETGIAARSLRRCQRQPSTHTQTVPRISANRNRAVFQLSFVPEFSDFLLSGWTAKNIF